MAKDPREYGYEGEMAMSQLKGIIQHAKQLHDMLKPDTDLPEWVQSKITLAYDYMQTATDYMSTEMNESKEFYADAKKRAKADTPQEKLSPAWKAKAKARASAAGRKYPNLVDNVWAARMQESVDGGAQIDELSKDTMISYLNKNKKDVSNKILQVGKARRDNNQPNITKLSNKIVKRHDGEFMAKDKLRKLAKEEAPANAVGGGNIAGMGVNKPGRPGSGEPGVGPKAMKKYKDQNAAEVPEAGRKTFSIFMQGK